MAKAGDDFRNGFSVDFQLPLVSFDARLFNADSLPWTESDLQQYAPKMRWLVRKRILESDNV